MTPERIKTIIHQAREAWMKGDAAGFAELFLPDGLFVVPGQQWQGKEAIHKSITEFSEAYTNVNIEISRILIDGDSAVVEWSWVDTEKASRKQSHAEDAIVVDFKDGLIQRWREYIDFETSKTQKKS